MNAGRSIKRLSIKRLQFSWEESMVALIGTVGIRTEILSPDVKENSMKVTAEQRLQYSEGMSLWVMPPSFPLPTALFLLGSLSVI